LANVLHKGSAILSVPEPEGFLVKEGISQIKVMGGAQKYVIVTQAALDLLHPSEVDCLILRALVHARQKHVRRLMFLQFLGDTPPAARLLAWPMSFYAALLNMTWHELAEQTADRLTLLLVKNPDLLMSAMLKQIAESDPLMMQNKVTAADVDAYIKQGKVIDIAGASVSTQYKIGSAIGDNPYVEERVNALTSWARSPEFKEALQKIADTKTGAATKTAK
jgi:Zn-dependent protease with chaperone function